jgi:hypothetical protein
LSAPIVSGSRRNRVSAALFGMRRLVASLMLVAMASFVLHGAAMARSHEHRNGATQCQPAHGLDVTAHHHDDHIRTAGQAADLASHDHGMKAGHHAPANGSCCSGHCPSTVAPFGIETVSAPVGLATTLRPGSQFGAGIDRDGLKRPPRTTSIA